jgi:hypothetical protein
MAQALLRTDRSGVVWLSGHASAQDPIDPAAMMA